MHVCVCVCVWGGGGGGGGGHMYVSMQVNEQCMHVCVRSMCLCACVYISSWYTCMCSYGSESIWPSLKIVQAVIICVYICSNAEKDSTEAGGSTV